MIDHTHESLLTIEAACRALPGKPCRATVWRWVLKGCRGVILESLVSGGRRFTSQEAIQRFIAATTNAARGPHQPTSVIPSSRQRANAIARAEAELAQ